MSAFAMARDWARPCRIGARAERKSKRALQRRYAPGHGARDGLSHRSCLFVPTQERLEQLQGIQHDHQELVGKYSDVCSQLARLRPELDAALQSTLAS
jgi:hypothetical protein